jgi:acyl-CoA reductase-like NAD-dependent aldehyde dehydrogenase
MSVEFVGKKEAAKILGISPETLKVYRRDSLIQEGLHYVRWNTRVIRYNKILIEDWAVNQGTQAHLRACERYLASLPSNQPKRSGASRKKAPALATGLAVITPPEAETCNTSREQNSVRRTILKAQRKA